VTATTVLPPDAAAYLAAVREALDDLPASERDDLLAEVETSLLERSAEGGSVSAHLGPPLEFAAELRAAAGLDPAPAAAPVQRRAWAESIEPAVSALRRLGTELAPIWWVARGYLLIAVAALLADSGWSGRPAALPHLPSRGAGLVWIAAAVVLSVAFGLLARRVPRARLAAVAVNVVLAAAAIPVIVHLAHVPAAARPVTVEIPIPAGLVYEGQPVDNVYPYSRGGRLLHDVLLYDGAGRPLELQTHDPLRRVLRARNGSLIFNAFPIRYFDPGTRRVARPNAGPPVKVPRIVTPPLNKRAKR
jgi:hypothetical protein